MLLKNLLLQQKNVILKRWTSLVLQAYLDDAGFFEQEKDRFGNPVGYTISKNLASLYDALVREEGPDRIYESLDGIIRIRAVQGFSPSAAIGFMFPLKHIVREALKREIGDSRYSTDLLSFESRIDEMVLLCVEIYSKCREKLYQIRMDEVKAERDRIYRLLERTGIKESTVGE